MVLRAISLPKTERFATRVKVVSASFGALEPLTVYFGGLGVQFKFDSRCSHRPSLKGVVIASLQVSRQQTAILVFYPIKAAAYPEKAVHAFEEEELPQLASWLAGCLERRETAILGYEQMIIEWTGTAHQSHVVRFL